MSSTIDKTTPPPEDDSEQEERIVVDASEEVPELSSTEGKSKVEQQAEEVARERESHAQSDREKEAEEASAALEALAPSDKPVRWIVGKPPELGGGEKQYSVYTQSKLGWMPRQKFFALVARTFSEAIKSTGGSIGGLDDVFGDSEGGSLVERTRRLTQRDFTDAASFMALAFELVAYVPTFLTDCYLIILDVPRQERGWAAERFNQPWDPDNGKYGLKDEHHEKIIETFIDQNFEEIRAFFVVKLPALMKRISLHERSKIREAARESKSDQ